MSGAPAGEGPGLAGDPGVIDRGPVLEFQAWHGAARHGGLAILPWRQHWLAARAANVAAEPRPVEPADRSWATAVVHLQKGRDAVEADLAAAWSRLVPGGTLLICGSNDLGIRGCQRRLEGLLGQSGEVRANRAHSRAVAFRRTDGPGPQPPAPSLVRLDATAGSPLIAVAAGGFSRDALDPGTSLLQAELAGQPAPGMILDLGCGAGHLAFAALRRWPHATAMLFDADARACAAARANADALGLAARATVHWWSAGEPLPAVQADLVLCNPPAHAGTAVAVDAGRDLLSTGAAALAPGGRLLAVANLRLPYEAVLAGTGQVAIRRPAPGFKILEVVRG